MKLIILLNLFLIGFLCDAQVSPKIKSSGKTVEEFVPTNWKIINTATGDLNKDEVDDFAFVIQEMDPKKIEINDGFGTDTLDTNPRILIILLRDTLTDQLRLRGLSRTFILNHDIPTRDEPFGGLKISNGVLSIHFGLWYSIGSWHVEFIEYKFRFQKNEFYLIGAEHSDTHRGTMENLKRSFNFVTRKMIQTTTTYEEDKNGDPVEKSKVERKTLDIKQLKTLKTLTTPLSWSVAPDVYI